MKKVIGIDIGGTKIAAGVITENGTIEQIEKIATHSEKGGKYIVSVLEEITERMWSDDIAGIGIGTAGQVGKNGEILSATNTIKDWKGINLQSEIQALFHLPVKVINDVQAMALGEQFFGLGKGVQNFICLALGTGVGGAIIENGHLARGASGAAGEFGHMILYPYGEPCPCGQQGCTEAYLSGKALEKRFLSKSKTLKTGKEIFKAASDGDENAKSTIREYIEDLSIALISLVQIFHPEKVILSGGVSESLEPYLQIITKSVCNGVSEAARQNLRIEISDLRERAMMLGAASLVL